MVRNSAVVSRVRGRTDWLLDAGLLTSDALANAVSVAEHSGQPLRQVLDRLGLVSQRAWAQAAGRSTGLRCIEADDFPDILASDDRLSSHYLRRHGLALLSLDGERPWIAIADPTDMHVRQALSIVFGREIDYVVATERDIETALTRSEAAEQAADDAEGALLDGGAPGAFDTDRLLELANNAPTVRYLDWLFSKAVESGATDIHIEMLETKPRVRLRIDGVLVPTQPIERHLYDGVVSRLKILGGMDISERRLPQDGSIRQQTSGRTVDVRVASAPTVHGEVMVLRLLDSSQARARLDRLDLSPEGMQRLNAALRQPNGLILMTGPTGSGKTTTLHAGLAELNDVGRKIITIENPVEIQNPGLIQMEVKPELGWSFASALRSVLRHDPDVLMVGEIRDGETAELAVRAAMTGHLVLSTLHTNRASEAVMRLKDMGVPEYLLSSVLRLVGAQRLIRTLCPHCSKPIDAATRARLDRLLQAFAEAVPELGPPANWDLRRATGCEACNNSGYLGRRALFEFVDVGRGEMQPVRTMGAEAITLFAQGETTLKEMASVFGSGKFWV
ncbi:MAG: GspE/PulE family protein [Pseudomonadota bacterium]